jgi:hypothetical protein
MKGKKKKSSSILAFSSLRWATLLSAFLAFGGSIWMVGVVGKGMRYSKFFEGFKGNTMVMKEALRIEEAWQWGNKLKNKEIPPLIMQARPTKSDAQICLAFVTAYRDGKPSKYIGASLKSLFEFMTPEEYDQLFTLAVIRGENPFPAVLDHFDKLILEESPDLGWNTLDQERRDYVAALEACNAQGAPYVVVLQDDIQATKNFVPAIFDVVHTANEAQGRDWAFLKLFYHEFWDGWSRETTHKLVAFCMFVAVIVFFSYLKLCYVLYGKLFLECFMLACVLTFVCVFLSAYIPASLGRQHVIHSFDHGLNLNRGSAAVGNFWK